MNSMKSSEHSRMLPQDINVDLQVALNESVALQSQVPSLHQFEGWVCKVLNYIGRKEQAEISIRVVDLAEMTTLNETYRQKTGPTNVLSFPYSAPGGVEIALLGDIAICLPVMVQESTRQAKRNIDHWAHIVIHGTLHLLGYDHIISQQAKQMEAIEIDILATFNITDPYGETEN